MKRGKPETVIFCRDCGHSHSSRNVRLANGKNGRWCQTVDDIPIEEWAHLMQMGDPRLTPLGRKTLQRVLHGEDE